MSFHNLPNGPDYMCWRPNGGKTDLRGPRVNAALPYIAVLGSSEVLDRYVAVPFTQSLSEALRLPVANLGVQNAGLDVFLEDEALLAFAAQAAIAVIQVTGAQNLSNRFYTVHPRRNDRFLRHSKMMEGAFRGADFSDFVFTRHMLATLREVSEAGFASLVGELQSAWVARMTKLAAKFRGKVVLLCIENTATRPLGSDPLFVTPDMIAEMAEVADDVVHCNVGEMIDDVHLEEMKFDPGQIDSARMSLPPIAHDAVARSLVDALLPLVEETDLKSIRDRRRPGRDAVA